LTVANKAHQSSSANLRAKIRDLKGQLKTNKGLENKQLNREIVDLMADTRDAKKEGERILSENLKEEKVELTCVRKEAVDKG
jgi:hypothetical protein